MPRRSEGTRGKASGAMRAAVLARTASRTGADIDGIYALRRSGGHYPVPTGIKPLMDRVRFDDRPNPGRGGRLRRSLSDAMAAIVDVSWTYVRRWWMEALLAVGFALVGAMSAYLILMKG